MKKQRGFISIIALGIFALLMIFAIMLQKTQMDTMNYIRNNMNKDRAESIANSTMKYLNRKMKSHDSGWNTGKVICGFGSYENETTTEGGGITGFCQDPGLLALANPPAGQAQKNIEMILQVKGRSDATDKLTTAKCGSFSNSCYVTPIPGTGDAGANCNMYKPNSTGTVYVDSSLTNGQNIQLDQLNYTCNWNKLSLGSSQTDRVAIPLYYDGSGLADGSSIVNPFKDGTAKNFMVRMRTPCKPCAPAGVTPDPDFQRKNICDSTIKDETLCDDTDRYQLNADPDQGGSDAIVAQWLINGECDAGGGKTEACGVMPIPQGVKDKSGKPLTASALYESAIYANNKNTFLSSYQGIDNSTLAYDGNNYPSIITLLSHLGYTVKLPSISKPVLTLFLNHPLWTPNKHNIPYLEYQVLTDQPIASDQARLETTITVDGNTFKKILTKQVAKPLIDFAIHN